MAKKRKRSKKKASRAAAPKRKKRKKHPAMDRVGPATPGKIRAAKRAGVRARIV